MGELEEFMYILILNKDLGHGLNRGNKKKNRTVKLFEFPYKVLAVVHACIPGF
jgi:hypothetical protein